MTLHLLFLVFGCVLLYIGADRLISSALQLGQRFNLSAAVTGLIIVAVGTSLPELAVSLDAAVHGFGAIAVGNVVGSNVVNITLVLGAAALFAAMPVDESVRRFDLPVLVLLTAFAIFLIADQALSRLDGILLLLVIGGLLVYRVRSSEGACSITSDNDGRSTGFHLLRLGIGVVLLVVGAEAMVASGIGMAEYFGVSEAVIALTVTAIGTGIPEIAATLVAVSRGHNQMAMGNIVGSNLINLGVVLGLTGLLAPVANSGIGVLPLTMLGAMTLLLWLFCRLFAGLKPWTAVALLSIFGVYQLVVVS
ncbi:MAG: calcium/sodium antiporter [Pseudomonadota bacterium]